MYNRPDDNYDQPMQKKLGLEKDPENFILNYSDKTISCNL